MKVAGEMAKEFTHALVTALKAKGVDVRFGAIGAEGAGVCGVISARTGSGPRWCVSTQKLVLGASQRRRRDFALSTLLRASYPACFS